MMKSIFHWNGTNLWPREECAFYKHSTPPSSQFIYLLLNIHSSLQECWGWHFSTKWNHAR